ncbi:glycosyltransferase family 2 protein [Corynebacterium mendelii]|uniref:4,4'-diaponeurosporenoate glycosyltransferase n=1 Tax=Corynebacterium mendelii TaxID=2765362 RepID=A0A939IXR5_9CORY|nr:glycosyltransferase family A protein [Corynebacterium mendelii]MBN9644333.1 glycosyltransferase family 2 protein [Corynebacterium mendelii]
MTERFPAGHGSNRRLSVVIPCLDDAELLRRALSGFARQTRPADEIIVVDNGCTDHSAAVAASFGARVVPEARRGITFATGTGFSAATGDVMLRTDADVVPGPDFIARLHRTWDAVDSQAGSGGREVVAVTGSGHFMLPDPAGRVSSALYLGAYRRSVGLALGHQPMFGTNYCIRRSFWEQVKDTVDFTDTVVHEDMQLSFTLTPDQTVWLQKDLVLEMDPRALVGAGQIARRFLRGMHTITVNWSKQPPWVRLAERGRLPAPLRQLV